jgi:transcription antitermination factor NusG
VKHQHERKAATHLQRKGVDVFLPEQKVPRVWKDRRKFLSLPLFPGYLFLRSDLRNKIEILNTPGIFFLVENAGKSCAIPDHEIDSIRRLACSGLPAREHLFVTAGDRVRVRSGPLSGVVGILTYVKNQYRVVLTVELLQKALSIEVEAANVERIEDFYAGNTGSVTSNLIKNRVRRIKCAVPGSLELGRRYETAG